jgi:tetratricopeptide (TPR) repeat protein
MKPELTDLDIDLPADPEEEYQSLVRSIAWTKGFGLIFVRCSPAVGEELITKIRDDIPDKKIEVLRLDQPIDNLYPVIENLPNRDEINILFVTGIEKSLVEFIKPGYGGQGDYYKLDTVPRILGHLNLQRERFRDNFNICFVFIVPLFALKYFIHRSPDFFDWRSGVFEFPTRQELLEQESFRILLEGDYEKYCSLTPEAQIQKVLEIQELLAENHQQSSDSEAVASLQASRANLQFELGNLLVAAKEYEAAIASYDQALKFKPDYYEAWYNRGIALGNLGRLEEAIVSYDKALKFKPDYHEAWNNRGIALGNLGQLEEAIASFDQALKFKPDKDEAWYNRGNALGNLGRVEEAIASYDQALKFKPDNTSAFYNKACSYALEGNVEQAIENLQQAINLSPDKYREMAKTDSDFDKIREEERFGALIQEALPDG